MSFWPSQCKGGPSHACCSADPQLMSVSSYFALLAIHHHFPELQPTLRSVEAHSWNPTTLSPDYPPPASPDSRRRDHRAPVLTGGDSETLRLLSGPLPRPAHPPPRVLGRVLLSSLLPRPWICHHCHQEYCQHSPSGVPA